MTEAMPFLQKYDITFLRPPAIAAGGFLLSLQTRITPCKHLRGSVWALNHALGLPVSIILNMVSVWCQIHGACPINAEH